MRAALTFSVFRFFIPFYLPFGFPQILPIDDHAELLSCTEKPPFRKGSIPRVVSSYIPRYQSCIWYSSVDILETAFLTRLLSALAAGEPQLD